MYIMEDDFRKTIISEKEKDLITQMDCKGIQIYKINNDKFKKSLLEISEGFNIYLCKEGTETKKCKIEEVEPLYINSITYDSNYNLYSYITAKTKIEAEKKFLDFLEYLNIYKNKELIDGVNIDNSIFNEDNDIFLTNEIIIEDKFPERTKKEKEKSQILLNGLEKMILEKGMF